MWTLAETINKQNQKRSGQVDFILVDDLRIYFAIGNNAHLSGLHKQQYICCLKKTHICGRTAAVM